MNATPDYSSFGRQDEGAQFIVECETCHDDIELEDAQAVLDDAFVCHPDLFPECLFEFNNQPLAYMRSEFYE